MKNLFPCQHISISIAQPPKEVYNFAVNPLNLPLWAKGLSQAEITQHGKE